MGPAENDSDRPLVLAYYFPNWHRDERNSEWFTPDWDEWHLVRNAKPRFPGHRQPRVPALGYFDEASPGVAEMQIALASTYGVDGFLIDYYWYDDGPYLQRALDEGIMQARNRGDVRFALMWANHQLLDIFPAPDRSPDRLKNGAIGREAFEAMVHHIITEYFSSPNYLTIDGCPWFSLYEVGTFVSGMGGLQQASDALEWFRQQVIAAGFPGLHLDLLVWGFGVLPEAVTVDDDADIVRALTADSASSYVWIHHADMADFPFPQASAQALREAAFADYERLAASLEVPFYPNVTVGWDSSPRVAQSAPFAHGDYPRTPVWDQTPQEFAEGLRRAQEFLREHAPRNPIVTINAWNEWTEGSSLLPDRDHGLAYLEAIREVFGEPRQLDVANLADETIPPSTIDSPVREVR